MKAWAKSVFLLPLFILYIFLGAFAFLRLEEAPSDEVRETFFKELTSFTLNHSKCLSSSELLTMLERAAVARAEGVIFPSRILDGVQTTWTWSNSIVFAATIVTTVGYGRFVPQTVGGQVFCIAFAIFGIPLCYTMLSTVGDTFQSLWQRSIRLFDKLVSCVKSARKRKVLGVAATALILWLFLVLIPAVIFAHTESWSMIDAQYFSFVSLSTIGFGDIIYGLEDRLTTVRQAWLYQIGMLVYFLIGLSVISIVFKGLWKAQKRRLKMAKATTRRFWKNRNGKHRSYSLGKDLSFDQALRQSSDLYKRKRSSNVTEAPTFGESSDEEMQATLSMDATVGSRRRRQSVFAVSYMTVATLRHQADQDSGHGSCNHSFVDDANTE